MFGKRTDNTILNRANKTDEEICGYIIDKKPVFVENHADDPTQEFLIRGMPPEAEGVFHSHPGGPNYPSASDMAQQAATAVPWGIACTGPRPEVFWFGEDVPHDPLIGRGFRHGVTDCYELIRHFYKEVHDISLMWAPRDWEWWLEGENMYIDNFNRAGFHEVDKSDILPGDVIFMMIASKVPNHAAVYLGDGLMLHHLTSRDGYDPCRLSTVEPAARWLKFITKVVRHEDDQIDRKAGQGIWPRV